MTMDTDTVVVRDNVSDGAMRIVEEVVKRTNNRDRSFLLTAICAELESRFVGDSLEYHLSQMHIGGTSDILHAIDLYFVMERLFPGTSFIRQSGNAEEVPA